MCIRSTLRSDRNSSSHGRASLYGVTFVSTCPGIAHLVRDWPIPILVHPRTIDRSCRRRRLRNSGPAINRRCYARRSLAHWQKTKDSQAPTRLGSLELFFCNECCDFSCFSSFCLVDFCCEEVVQEIWRGKLSVKRSFPSPESRSAILF